MAKSSAVIAAFEIARRIYDCPTSEITPVYMAIRPEDYDLEDFQQN
jgi:leucyl aminopeptidase